jgi:hypothetical protein
MKIHDCITTSLVSLPSPRPLELILTIRPRIGREGPQAQKRYSSILSLTSALHGDDG